MNQQYSSAQNRNWAKVLAVPGCAILVSIVTVLGVSWGTVYVWPDYVHTNYGVPFVWGTHTLNTISGPADTWSVDLYGLALDLTVWLAVLVTAVTALSRYFSR